MSLGTVRITQE